MKYETHFKDYLTRVNQTLEELLPPQDQYPQVIHEAMRYSVFPGGKRFRPVLVFAACEAVGGDLDEARIPAAAIELIHSYSLVHDDLPALDDDDERRGKPTCHKTYGEAMAVLTGDALLTLAFQVLTRIPDPKITSALLAEISTASGTYGMIGGQVADITELRKNLTLPMLDYISVHKTGKLIKASAVAGALVGKASREICERIRRYGEYIGHTFQAVDDLHDGDGYLDYMKPVEVRQKIKDLIAQAQKELGPLGRKAEKLIYLSEFLLKQIPSANHA